MLFTKPSISIADQIALLESRGMGFPDKAEAEHYLQHVSYYRLRAYWLVFEISAGASQQHAFRPGTTFDQVVDLYIFDRKLRLLILDAIERFEVSVRGSWAHHLAMKYGPHGYLQPAIYRDVLNQAKNVVVLDREKERSSETFIFHYKNVYNEPKLPPVWMAAELLSFGSLSRWIDDLKLSIDRTAIASPYNLKESVFTSIVHHLSYVRNVCAHHSRLWNRSLTIKMTLPRRPDIVGHSINRSSPDNIYNTLVVVAYLMGFVAPHFTWKQAVRDLIQAHPAIPLLSMGFPTAWDTLPIWI